MSVQHTLALIKPEGMSNEKKIIARFKKEGFMILVRRRVHLTPEQVSEFYQDQYGRKDFPLLVATTSAAPVTVLVLGREDAVEILNHVVGPSDVEVAKAEFPKCLNAEFGNLECNLPAVHASKDLSYARREILFFFSQAWIEPVTTIQESVQYFEKELRPLLKEGLALMLKEKPTEPMLWLAGWMLKNNPNQPRIQEHLRHHHF